MYSYFIGKCIPGKQKAEMKGRVRHGRRDSKCKGSISQADHSYIKSRADCCDFEDSILEVG